MSKLSISPKHFSMLCEHILLEYSASAASIGSTNPYVKEIVLFLHRSRKLPNDFDTWEKISMPFKWNELFTPYPSDTPRSMDIKKRYANTGSFTEKVLVLGGKTGAAAIVIDGSSYYVYAKSENIADFSQIYSGRSGNDALAEVKKAIGKPTEIYLAKYVSAPSRTKITKTPTGISSDRGQVNQYLFKKFEPLLDKAIQKAIAELKSMAMTQVKNDADVDKITKKLKQIKQLNNVLEEPDGKEKFLGTYLYNAILATASYYYPDDTGNITARYGGSWSPQNSDGMYQVQKDIANKDMEKIAAVLYYLRQGLMR